MAAGGKVSKSLMEMLEFDASIRQIEAIREVFGFKALHLMPSKNRVLPYSFATSGRYELPGFDEDVLMTVIAASIGAPKAMPEVKVSAPWLSPFAAFQDQSYANWHRYRDDSICYEKPERWVRICENNSKLGANGLYYFMAQKVKKDVDAWLGYHRVAYEHNLSHWQVGWKAHAHGA